MPHLWHLYRGSYEIGKGSKWHKNDTNLTIYSQNQEWNYDQNDVFLSILVKMNRFNSKMELKQFYT